MSCLVAVDIGNSSIKLGWFPAGESDCQLPANRVLTLHANELLSPAWNAFAAMVDRDASWVMASVNQQSCDRLIDVLSRDYPEASVLLLENRMLPLEAEVDSLESVGTDRLLATLAVKTLVPEARPAIVIDSGTAVTVDVITRQGTFAGGVIMPGSALIARALSGGTDRLPEVVLNKEKPPEPIGTNTSDAITAGIYWGLVGSINELIRQQRKVLGQDTPVFISGGDGWIARHLDAECQEIDHLCLLGIAAAAKAGFNR